ncbi:chitinase-3-like protein 1 [Ornithodoros turicata]|uniref:chitinase-3-like protein 1 n=1 Tax=Ornithodoros turicata TaxID=34597 RepID=UPI00313870A9
MSEQMSQSFSEFVGTSVDEDQSLKYYKDEMVKSNTMLYVTRISFVIFVVFAMYLLGMLFVYRTSDTTPQPVLKKIIYQNSPRKECFAKPRGRLLVASLQPSEAAPTGSGSVQTPTDLISKTVSTVAGAVDITAPGLSTVGSPRRPGDKATTPHQKRLPPDHLIFCIYNHTTYKRKLQIRLELRDIPVGLCTHIVYYAVGIDSSFSIRATEEIFDVEQGGLDTFVSLRNLHNRVKFLLCVGETTDDWRTFQDIVSDTGIVRSFSQNLLRWILRRKFDGIIINWRYLHRNDKWKFNGLVEHLKSASHRRKLSVSVLLPHAEAERISYDVAQLGKIADFLLVDMFSDHNHTLSRAVFPVSNEDITVLPRLLKKELGRRNFYKICPVLPLQGLTFTLRSKEHHHIGASVIGPGMPGKYSGTPGMLSYSEICPGNWSFVSSERFATFAVRETQWVGYHDASNLRNIMMYLRRRYGCRCFGLRDIGHDDFRGVCGPPFPLLHNCFRNVQMIGDDPHDWIE